MINDLFYFGDYIELITAGKLKGYAEDIARDEKVQVFAIGIDCSDSKSINDAFEAVLSLGKIQVLVYNAYPHESGSLPNFLNLSLEYFKKCLNVSVVGAYHCAQKVWNQLLT